MEFKPLGISFSDSALLDHSKLYSKEYTFLRHNQIYLDHALGDHAWIVILTNSGTLYTYSDTFSKYMSEEDLQRIAVETNEMPCCWPYDYERLR